MTIFVRPTLELLTRWVWTDFSPIVTNGLWTHVWSRCLFSISFHWFKMARAPSFISGLVLSSCLRRLCQCICTVTVHFEAFYRDRSPSADLSPESAIQFTRVFLYEPMVHDYCVFDHCICGVKVYIKKIDRDNGRFLVFILGKKSKQLIRVNNKRTSRGKGSVFLCVL